MVGSLINAFSSKYKAKKAQRDEYAAHDRLLELDKNRPGYTGEELAKQSVNPLYDANIKMLEPHTKTNLLAGQSYAQNRVDNNAANAAALAATQGFSSPSQYAQLLGILASSQNKAHTDMAIQGAQNRMVYQGQLADAHVMKAEEQDKAWAQNVWEPYKELKDREYMQWVDAMGRKEQHRTNQQAAGAQAGQDAGNFAKTFFTKGMGGGGNTQQSVQASQSPAMANPYATNAPTINAPSIYSYNYRRR